MRRVFAGIVIAASGLFVSWIGQGIWRHSPDTLWATVAVVSVLAAVAIALNPTISRLLGPITGVPQPPR